MQLSVHDLFARPDLYLFAFENDDAIFLQMDREAYHRSIFLDGRIAPLDPQRIRAPIDAIATWRDQQRLPIGQLGWIFHVANCGSTLLARALDRLRADLVLREPMALRQHSVIHRRVPPQAMPIWDARLRLLLTQYAKRFRPEGPVIIKANVPVNFVLPQVMAADPDAPAICLYYPLRDYLLAILRSDGHRDWVMRVTNELLPALTAAVGPVSADPVDRAAALWLAQLRQFAATLDQYPRAFSLNATTLFGQPGEVIRAAADLYGMPLDDVQLTATLESTLFNTYAKNPGVAFTENDRRARAESLARTMASELNQGRRWVDDRIGSFPLPDRLTRPLTGEAPRLLG